MFFKKNFDFDLSQGLTLTNRTELEAYMKEKIDHFIIHDNYSSKEEKLKFLGEIIDMCDYDITNSTFDYSKLPSIQETNINDLQPQMIYLYNLATILGGVFLNVFDEGENRIARVEYGISGAISTSAMFMHAYDELIRCKNNDLTPAYGATLILATLFEKDIKEHTKMIYAKDYLNSLKNAISTRSVTLTSDENDLFDFLQFHYEMIPQRTTSAYFDTVKATSEMQYSLLRKYNIISSDSEIKKLLCNKFTLTPFIHSSLFKNIADDRFVKIISLLFDSSNLNLRNHLAHCNFTYMNYYSIYVTALLFALFTMVIDESFLK